MQSKNQCDWCDEEATYELDYATPYYGFYLACDWHIGEAMKENPDALVIPLEGE